MKFRYFHRFNISLNKTFMKKIFLTVIKTLIFGLFWQISSAQNNFVPFAGMRDNPLHDIISDAAGNRYLCSEKGIFRIDVNFNHEKISSEQIRTMLIAGENKFAGSYNGRLSLFAAKNPKNVPLATNAENLITALAQDSEGNIWIASFGNGLFRADKKGDKITPVSVKNSDKISHILDLITDGNDGKWIASDQGLFYMDKYNKKIEKIEPFVSANALTFDAAGFEIWVAGSKKDGTLGLFKGTKDKFAETELPAAIQNSFINQLYYDPNGRIWVCSSVLAFYDAGNWTIFDESRGLKTSSVACVHVDKNRNIWAGTDGSGLFVSYSNADAAKKREEVKIIAEKPLKPNQTALENALTEGIDLSKDYPIKIQFDEDKDLVKTEYEKELGIIAEILSRNPDLKAEIKGHTERSNNLLYIQKLSEKRAKAVKNFLVGKKGVKSERLNALGFGAKYPLSMDPRNAAVNRRVEIRFFKK